MLQRFHQQGPVVKGGGKGSRYFLYYRLPTSLTGAVHDELCRQVSKTLGASGCAIRGAERRCAASTLRKQSFGLMILNAVAEAMNAASAQK